MKNTQIIKDNVKPILTPVEKVRYTQASSFFIKGMTGYLVNYVKGVKQMVDTRQVSEHYSKLYKEQANQFVERFNEHNKEVEKEKSKIIPLLLVFSAGGYLLYKSLKYVSEKFVKQLKHINHFIQQIYQLGKKESSKVLSYTQTWAGRIFGGNGIDVQGIIGDAIKNIPDLIGGMFNFIVNSFDWLFNKSELFSSILIDVAKRAYNASFSSSWGWVIGLVFDRAKVKQAKIASSSSYAKFGPEVQREIMFVSSMMTKYFGSETAYTEWKSDVMYWDENNKKQWTSGSLHDSDDIEKFTALLQSMSESTSKHISQAHNYIQVDNIYQIASNLMLVTDDIKMSESEFQFQYDRGWVLEKTYLLDGSVEYISRHSTPNNDRKFSDSYIWTGQNNEILKKLDFFYKKYIYLKQSNKTVNQYVYFWQNKIKNYSGLAIYTDPKANWSVRPDTMLYMLRLLHAWILFDYQFSQHQSTIQGIRFHSRFQQSYVDNIRDTLLQQNQTLQRKNRGELYDYFKMYDDGVYSFDDYIDRAVYWLNRQRSSFRTTKLGQLVINFIPNRRYDFNQSDKVNWRRMFGIPKIERQLIQIKNIFRNIQQQVKYGVSYADGNIYYFSDQVSDASLQINKFDNLYQGVFKERDKEKNPQGIEVGTYDVSGIGRNAEDTLGNKSSLAYAAKQITQLYVDFRRNVNNLRRDRNTLITVFLQKLKYLYTCKLIYEKFKKPRNQIQIIKTF